MKYLFQSPMLIKYSDIYNFYYEKYLPVNAAVLGVLLALFILTCIMGQRSAVSKFIWRMTAILSFFTLLYVTVFSRVPGSIGDESLKYLLPYIYGDKKKIEIMGNIIMFIPFGASLRMIIKARHPFLKVCMTGIIASLMFECMQFLLKCGYMEIIDLMTNGAGMTIGCLAASIVIGMTRESK